MSEQPGDRSDVPNGMGPLEIAKSRLHDLAQGASPDLFDQASAIRVWNRLVELERRHQALLERVLVLPAALEGIDITGPVVGAMRLCRVLDEIDKEARNGS